MPTYDEPDVYEDEWYDDPSVDSDSGEPPATRRRRPSVTPVTVGLAAVLIGAGGFIAGVQVQKGQQKSASTGTSGGLNPRTFAGGFSDGGGASSGAPTAGSVTSKKGDVLYVESSSGTTVKVKLTSNSKVTRTAKSSPDSIHPGDTVIVQGTKGSSGSVTATSVTAIAKGATSGLRGGFSGGGGGGFRPPGATTSGGSGGGGSAGGGPPAGFGPPPGG